MTSKKLVKSTHQVADIRALLEKNKAQIALALPKHLTADRMLRVALTAIQKTPELLDADQKSLFACIIQAAQLGLEPDGTLGQAYLVPFWNSKKNILEAQFIPGYKGLLSLVRRSGAIGSVEARAVHAGDKFRYRFGLDPILEHEPIGEDATTLTHVYALAYLRDGGGPPQWDVMRKFEVDRIRSRSRAKDSGPWVTDYDEMAKKTVLRRLCKLLPMSVEAQKALDLDERAELGLPQDLDTLPGVTDADGSKLDKFTAELTGAEAPPADPAPQPEPPPGDLLGPQS